MAESQGTKKFGTEHGETNRTLVILDAVKLAKFVLCLPIFGFISCIVLSMIYNFEQATATHCKVANYLPSTSAAIGGFTPQRYIWRLCIGLHCGPRVIMAVGCYYHDYVNCDLFSQSSVYSLLVKFNAGLHLGENACLLFLSMISSTENYHLHENCFIGFLVFSELYMICTLVLFRCSRNSRGWTPTDIKSYRLKWIFFGVNLLTCLFSAYVFVRHNTYCEPGVYTLFAACEYTVIITNILFHGTCMLDYRRGHIVLTDTDHSDVHGLVPNKLK